MRTFNLVKSLSTLVNNITSLPFREGLGLGLGKVRMGLRLLILCLSLATFGVESAWGGECNYTKIDFVSSKQVEKNGNTYWALGTRDYYDIPTYTFCKVQNDYGIQHIYINAKFTVAGTKSEKFHLQYSFNNSDWINIKTDWEVKDVAKQDNELNIDLNIAATGDYVYFRLERVDKVNYTDSDKKLSLTVNIRKKPFLSATPTSLDFGNVTYGQSASQTIAVSFASSESTSMSISTTSLFSASLNSTDCGCNDGLQEKVATITFTPDAVGEKSGTATISGPNGLSATISLKGMGLRAAPILEMNNGEVTVYTDAGPHTLDLNTLKKTTNKTNGDYTYELLGTDAEKRGASINGSTFKSTVGGTFKVRATTSQTGQYESTTCDFQVTVNRLTPAVTWTPDEDTFVAEEQIAVTSAPGVELNLSTEGDGAEYVTIDNNNKIFIIEDYSGATPITATLKVTSAQTDVYEAISGKTKSITISNLTKQHIIWNQDQALTKLKITDNPRSIVLTATSDNGEPVSRYVLEGEITGFSLSQNGDTWTLNYPNTASKGAFVRAELDGVEDQYLPASPISLPIKVIDPTSACDINEDLATVSGLKNDKKEYALAIPKSVYLHVRRTNREWYALYTNGIEIEFQNAQGSRVGSVVTKSQNDIDDDCDITIDNLDRSITKMIFKSNAGYGYDITVANYTHHSEIGKDKDKLTYETYVGTPVDNQQVTINYANHQIEVSIEDGKIDGVANASSHFSIISGSSFGDCGVAGSNAVTVGYTDPGYPCTETATLCVRDNTGALLTSLSLSAKVLGGLDQHISFINLPQTFSTTDKVTLQATSDREFEHQFTYSVVSGYTDVAKVEGDKLTFLKDGDFKLRVYEPGTKLYTEAEAFTEVLHVSKVTPTIVTLPTVGNAITYGSPLSDVALTGGSAKDDKNNAVSGHFEWASPTEIPHGGQQNYTVRFVPGNTNMYTSDAVSTETLAITVNKANQTLTWNVESPIKIKKEDGNYTLTASSTSGRAITYTLSDPTLGTVNGNILTPIKSGDCRITAVCPADNDYNASNSIEKNLFIAGPDEIVWKYKTGDHVWVGQNLNADGELATAHTTVWFGKDETQGYLTVNNNTDPKTVYTAIASDGTLVTISATTAGDDYYARVESSIQVYIDRCYQGLNWDQSFVAYTATKDGYINVTEDLTAVAVDSLDKPTNLPIVYSVDNPAVAEITGDATDGWKLHIKGAGEATLTATVDQTNIYQGVIETRKINVRKEGEHCGSYALISTGEKKISNINDNTYTFDVPGETLTFKTRKYVAITLNANVTVEGYNIEEGTWQYIDKYNLNFTDKQTKTYTISEKFRGIKMYTDADLENSYRYISDLYITQKEYIRPSVTEINENIFINQDFSKTFTVDYSDKPYINCTIDNDNLELVRSGSDNDCGTYGTLTFTIKNKDVWDTPREYNATITLTTSVGDNKQIPVHIKVDLGATYKFTNKTGDGDWENLNNWDYGGVVPSSLPQTINPVEIQQPVRISSNVDVYSLTVQNDAQQGTQGSVTIAPTGGLTVYNGGVTGLNDKLIIESSRENTGYFRVAPNVVKGWAAKPTATVEFATKSTLDNGANNDAEWQYFGVAVGGVKFTADYITWLYDWDETKGWVNLKDDKEHDLVPFHGYVITQYGQPTYSFHGPLLMDNEVITLSKSPNGMNGDNIFANSYPAPIDVKKFTETDFEGNVDKVFYLFNSGSWNQWQKGQDKDNVRASSVDDTPGTYYAIPALSSPYLDDSYQTIIPPMSGVYVIAHENGAKIHLNYEKHVWSAASSNMNRPLRAPQKVQDEESNLPLDIIPVDTVNYAARLSHRVVLAVRSANSGNDRISILERQDDSYFTQDYDNGYDATKILTEGIANIYTNELAGTMAISATNNADSMFIGFNAGEDYNYELFVTSVIGDDLELMDMQTGDRFALRDGASYEFAATPNSEDPYRFRIFKSETKPVVPTGWTGLGDKAKIWYNKQVIYISDAAANSTAAIYTADGVTLKQVTFNHNTTISTADMPEGVYTVRVEDSVLKFFVKH